jgi:hypothetical protein
VAPGCIVCNTAEAPVSGKERLPAATGLHERASKCSASHAACRTQKRHLFGNFTTYCQVLLHVCVFLAPNCWLLWIEVGVVQLMH